MENDTQKNAWALSDFIPAAAMLLLMSAVAVVVALKSTVLEMKPAEEMGGVPPAASAVMAQASASQSTAGPQLPEGGEVCCNIRIEVNIPATEMTVFENDVPLFTRRVAIGQGVYPTPALESSIKKIEWNPWWYPPPEASWAKGAKPTPPGPGNPLGLVKMPLSSEILFHGTNKDSSVGNPASHGCMRMHNGEVAAIAWYLQKRFSSKADPALRDLYRKNRGTTYSVDLSTPIPVKLVYKPVMARGGSLFFYPDHYNRLGGRRKAALLTELVGDGIDISGIDDDKVEGLLKTWPARGTEVPILSLMRKGPEPELKEWPECN